MDGTKIEWTDATWNPVRGCSRVSEGCRNCYAERVAARFSGPGMPYEGLARSARVARPDTRDVRVGGLGAEGIGYYVSTEPRWTGAVQLVVEHLYDPLRWRRPRRVFVNSMSDLFHEKVPDDWIDRIFAVMALAPQHVFQILTKRPERMRRWFTERTPDKTEPDRFGPWSAMDRVWGCMNPGDQQTHGAPEWPLLNVWLGVSCEDQETADERIPILLDTPAAVRFVSAEPLLGPVDLRGLPIPGAPPAAARDALNRAGISPPEAATALDWVIVGGESGPGARPCDVAWVRLLVAQCRAAGVACFVKQLGAFILSDTPPSLVRDGAPAKYRAWIGRGKCGDPSKWPEDMRVREFPKTEAT